MEKQVFAVDVEGIGTFQFRRRTMRENLRIDAEYSRLTEGVETPSKSLDLTAEMMSTLKVLTEDAPDGWDVDALDPLDPETYRKLIAVYSALREKEEFFRRGPGKAGQGDRQTSGGDDGVVVPADVQPGAD
ncbi:MAG TPA: hypothetical protein VFL54_09960 [Gammaproteobacteria bacterium]|nr:hypothetical protein [Gammaproteobacteria bacterium]